MLHHPRIAIVTAHLMPASPAQRDRRIAAAVQKQQALLTLGHPRLHLRRQLGRNPAIRGQGFAPHINRLHLRQLRHPKARAQIQTAIFARLNIGPRLKAGRG